MFFKRIHFMFVINRLIRSDDLTSAKILCKKYIERYPLASIFHGYLAKIYFKQEDFSKAIEEYEFLIKQKRAGIQDYFDLMSSYLKLRNYSRIISLSEDLPNVQFNVAEQYILKHEYSRDNINYYLGVSYYNLGDYKKSLQSFKNITSLKFVKEYEVDKYIQNLKRSS